MKDCANCGTPFDSNRKNQKYCTPVCCKLATNKKIMEKYYERKKRLSGEIRHCECGQLLSRYNANTQCHPCAEAAERDNRASILGVIENVIKKTNKTKR